MPTLKCLSCDFEATTRTRTALLKKLTQHAASAHHVPTLPVEIIDNVRMAMGKPAVVASPHQAVLRSYKTRFS